MAFSSQVYISEFWRPDNRCFFSTDPELFYIYLHYNSEKVHGTFDLGYENHCDIYQSEIYLVKCLCRNYGNLILLRVACNVAVMVMI